MRKTSFLAVVALCLLFLKSFVFAQSSVELEASVGRFHFSASGIISPFASVVMTTQDIFLASAVADQDGKFYIPPVLVNDGFNNFCLEAIDVKRIGVSYTCFDTDIPTEDFEKNDIFLPPTVKLSGNKLKPNSTIMVSGYTMPESRVDVVLDNGYEFRANSDKDGYYSTEVKDLPTGAYQLFATSTYKTKTSEKPTRKFEIEVLGWFSLISFWIILILIIIALIIPLIILWKRRRRDKNSNEKKKSVKKS